VRHKVSPFSSIAWCILNPNTDFIRNRHNHPCAHAHTELADQTFYRPSLKSILDSLRTKLQLLSQANTFQTLPSLQRTLTSIGLGPLIESLRIESGEDGVEGSSGVKVEIKVNVRRAEDERVLGLARTRVALDVMGQYLGHEVKQVVIGSYE
jgi:hypothetical protein